MNKNFKSSQTNLKIRCSDYAGTVPTTPEGLEFIRCLRILFRSHGADLGVAGRGPRSRHVGKSHLNGGVYTHDDLRRNLPFRWATSADLYLRNRRCWMPKYHLMSLDEVQNLTSIVSSEILFSQNEFLKSKGFNPSTLTRENRNAALKSLGKSPVQPVR